MDDDTPDDGSLDDMFQWRRRDQTAFKPCPNCGHLIQMPTSDPWVGGMPPESVFRKCDGCGEEVEFSLDDIDPTIPPPDAH